MAKAVTTKAALEDRPLDRSERRVALEIINAYGFDYNFTHTLYRVAHVYRDGLTTKEYRFLTQRIANIEEELRKVQQLRDRLNKTCQR